MLSQDEKKPIKALIFMCIFVILLFFGLGVFFAHMEAKTYNKITGNNVTWWDAMWVDLRVQDSPTKK